MQQMQGHCASIPCFFFKKQRKGIPKSYEKLFIQASDLSLLYGAVCTKN